MTKKKPTKQTKISVYTSSLKNAFVFVFFVIIVSSSWNFFDKIVHDCIVPEVQEISVSKFQLDFFLFIQQRDHIYIFKSYIQMKRLTAVEKK